MNSENFYQRYVPDGAKIVLFFIGLYALGLIVPLIDLTEYLATRFGAKTED